MDHIRIDEGLPRKPRKFKKPNELERKARNEAGQFLTRYTPEARSQAIEECKLAIECGARIDDIADKLSIPRSTLYSWLVGEENAGRLRTQFFDGQCARALVEIRAAEAPLDLARADRELNGWLKVAAVRDPHNYGPHNTTLVITADLESAIDKARERAERVIQSDTTPDCVQIEQKTG